MAPDEVASQASFFFNSHIDFFEEIAKFRAARRLWAKWMRTRYGCTKSGPCACGSTPRRQAARSRPSSPTTTCAHGLPRRWRRPRRHQSLHTNSLDEVLALPTEEAAELALRTQQILAYETARQT